MLLLTSELTEETPVDPLREALAVRTTAKVDATLKTKGRLIIDFKTPAQALAALAALPK